MNAGRPRDNAPEGYLTTREAAEWLGVTPQAIYNRIERGSLQANEIILQSGERRKYVLRKDVEREIAHKDVPATRADTSEVQLRLETFAEMLAREIRENRTAVVGEVARQREEVLEELRRQGEARREQFERVLEIAERIETKSRRPWWKKLLGLE